MINQKKILGIIPARAGSKRLPKKNIRELNGKPLICWTIEAAQKSKYIDNVILSSDDHDAIDIALKWNCDVPFVRPSWLASDIASSTDVVRHAINAVNQDFEYVILLQPTSPLRTTEDIDRSIELLVEERSHTCVRFCSFSKPASWVYKKDSKGIMRNLFTDPNLVLYYPNGAIYIAEERWIKENDSFISSKNSIYMMPLERSIDVDTEYDWQIAQYIIKGEGS